MQATIASGADVVFGMGDGATLGYIQAVETSKKKVWFIDVIGNPTPIDKKGAVLSSVLWDFSKVFKQAIADINAGTYGTKFYTLGLNNGVSLMQTKYIPGPVLEGHPEDPQGDHQRFDQGAADADEGVGRGADEVAESLVVNADRPHGSDSTAGAGAPAVELIGITKTFPGVVANDDIDLAIRAGEVHCLLGENGAGKSTLMSVLSGMTQPDAGRIRVAGRDVRIDSPRSALAPGRRHGLPALDARPGAERAREPAARRGHRRAPRQGRRRGAAGRARRDARRARRARRARTGDLSLGEQQQVEIIKALWRGSNVLILDEPTSMLTPEGVAELQKVLVRLKEAGGRARLHHAQAARGDLDRRPRHDPQAGTRRRHPRRARAALAHAGAAAGRDRPHHVRRGGGRERSGRRARGHAA